MKLSLNSDLCFIFLRSQNTILDPVAPARMCSDRSILVNLAGVPSNQIDVTLESVDGCEIATVEKPDKIITATRDQEIVLITNAANSSVMEFWDVMDDGWFGDVY